MKKKLLSFIFTLCLILPAMFCLGGCKEKLTKYDIIYELDGGTNHSNNPLTFNEKTNTITLLEPTKEGYSFEGWYSDENFQTEVTSIEIGTKTDIVLYAKWSINQYTITFNTNGSGSIVPITENYGTTITAPTEPIKDGYIFVGWYKNSSLTELFTFDKMPARDTQLYAKYEAMFTIVPTISYNCIVGLSNYARNIEGLEVVIPDQIDGYNITSIRKQAFLSNSNIVSITIGNNVTEIGEYAFARCSELKTVVIPNSVVSMGDAVFFECPNLTTAKVGSGLKVLPEGTFGRCKKLTSLTLSEGLTTIGEIAIAECTALQEITIPNSVTTLQKGALGLNTALTTVNMGTGVKTLGDAVFAGDTKLTTISLPEGIQTLSKGLFSGCSSLISVVLPSTLTTIGDSVFASCSNLQTITIPKSVTTMGKIVFQECENLETVTFANDAVLTSMGDYMFQGCSNLKTINLPSNLQEISEGLFYECTSLRSIIIPSKVTKIEFLAFAYCPEIYVYIPSSVTTILSEYTSLFGTTQHGPFYHSNGYIYCEIDTKPSGWDYSFAVTSTTSHNTSVLWSQTLEDFNNAISE